MTSPRLIEVAGLGFGDEGKGSVVDFLSRAAGARAVVRYNGGPQAAHHVVLDDGRWHCFAQFGSGTFVPQVMSHISRQMLWKPQNLLAERDALVKKGVTDALARLTISSEAFVVTPWHAMLRRMEETARGKSRHGSCGLGVGKAALDRLEGWENGILARDLLNPDALWCKILSHWSRSRQCAEPLMEQSGGMGVRRLFDETVKTVNPEVLHRNLLACAREIQDCIVNTDNPGLRGDGIVILEGAQGVLLDHAYGFGPYVTKTDTTMRSAGPFLERSGFGSKRLTKLGVLRAYATRHGAGPLVTCSAAPGRKLAEAHNQTNEWQGEFRSGPFDLLASRYACAVAGGVDYLALTCLDRLAGRGPVRVCTSYLYQGSASEDGDVLTELFTWERSRGVVRISGINVPIRPTPERQAKLAAMLFKCKPAEFREFKSWSATGPDITVRTLQPELSRFLSYLESPEGLGIPVGLISNGPTAKDKTLLKLRL